MTAEPTTDRAAIARRALACLDLTELSETADSARIAQLCADALTAHGPVAAVCVWPRFVTEAKAALGPDGPKVATVANFPDGHLAPDRVEADIAEALEAGADEIDVVIPWSRFVRGETAPLLALVGAARAATKPPAPLKVILETGALGDQRLVAQAAEIALAAGADFLKTSTGKTPVGATPEAARTLLDAITASGFPTGLKVSGGVRTMADAAFYVAEAETAFGAAVTPARFRIGASGLLTELLAVIEGRTPPSEDDAPPPSKGY